MIYGSLKDKHFWKWCVSIISYCAFVSFGGLMLFSTCLHCKNAIAVYSRCEAGQRVFPRLVFCHEGITSKWHFPFHQVSIFFSIRFSPWLRFCVITSGIATFTGRQSLTFLQRCVTQLLLSPSIAKKLKKKRGRCFLEKYSEQIVIGKKKGTHTHTHIHIPQNQ